MLFPQKGKNLFANRRSTERLVLFLAALRVWLVVLFYRGKIRVFMLLSSLDEFNIFPPPYKFGRP